MPSLKRIKITVETPPEIGKLSKDETESLKKAFGAAIANVLGSKLPESLLTLPIDNVTRPPGGGVRPSSKASEGSRKGAKKGAKKSNK